jgi:3-phenylpropionate/trans-cinnamate dioxygenase ferredoxin subunit
VEHDDERGIATVTDHIRVGAFAEIPEGEVRAFELPTGRVAVTHVERHLYAFGDACTHEGCPLSEGTFDDRVAEVTCPCHGSVFDVETGEPVGGPAQDPVPVYAVREVEGWIEVAAHPDAPG